MSFSQSNLNIVKNKDLQWATGGRAPREDMRIGQRVKFYPTQDEQLGGYLAAAFCDRMEVDKKKTRLVQLAGGPDGYIYLRLGAPEGAKLSRQGPAFRFSATRLAQGVPQLPLDTPTTWELHHVRRDDISYAEVRLKELTW